MIPVVWRPRAEPLAALAVAATGSVARALARRVLERSDEELARLRGVTWADGLALQGEAGELSWADGAGFFGRDGRAPKFLWPCVLEPDAPLELFALALERAFEREIAPPILVLPNEHIAVSLASARPVERAILEAWLGSNDAA